MDFAFYDFDDEQIIDAVFAVTGDTVWYGSIDDEHAFWFQTDQDGNIIDNGGVESVEDFYNVEQVGLIQKYLMGSEYLGT